MKTSNETTGIEPATFRFVAQHLNHCATAVPSQLQYYPQINMLMRQVTSLI